MDRRLGPRSAVPPWFRDATNRMLLLLALALLTGVASLVSFIFVSGGDGPPSTLELGLLMASLGLTFYLSMQTGGG